MRRIELPSSAWKAEVLAFELHPQVIDRIVTSNDFDEPKKNEKSLPRRVRVDLQAVDFRPVKSSIENLEDSKVKVNIEVSEDEIEDAIDEAFKKIAKEVKMPGFRQGKAPRKVLEAKFGRGYARSEALNEIIGEVYFKAVNEHELDVIAQPDVEIVDGQETGPVLFEATVEIRPEITINGYKEIQIEIPSISASEEEIQESINKLREQSAERIEVKRPASDGDFVTMDISGAINGEAEESLTAEGFTFEIGSGFIIETINESLIGAEVGEVTEFGGPHPSEEESQLTFEAHIKKIEEKKLPDLTDELVNDLTEFDTVELLTADTEKQIIDNKRNQTPSLLSSKLGEALSELVTDEVPEALIQEQIQQQVQDMAMRMAQQGMQFEQFLQATGQSIEDLVTNLREPAEQTVKTDLALRAIAISENFEISSMDIEEEMEEIAKQYAWRAAIESNDVDLGEDLTQEEIDNAIAPKLEHEKEKLEHSMHEHGQIRILKADLLKQKALKFIEDSIQIIDEDGNEITRDELLLDKNTDKDAELSETSNNPDSDDPDSEEGSSD